MSKKRMIGLLCGLFLVFGGLLAYLFVLSRNHMYTAAAGSQGYRTITVAQVRGTIYDRDLQPLVNAESEYRAAILPQERLLAAVRPAVEPAVYQSLLETATAGAPAVVQLSGPIAITQGLQLFFTPVRYGGYVPAVHLIGHLDGSGLHGATGLEYAFDDLLSEHSGEISVSYAVDGAGRYLAGEDATVRNNQSAAAGGIVLTIDRDIQEIVDSVVDEHQMKGAVVVLDPHSGEILASTSYPIYHPEQVAESIQKKDGALLNRALALYDCGSVFKIVTAAAALECGVPLWRSYTCNGSMQVDKTVFHCHERLVGHGELTMEEAFAHSCNLYFIQLAQEIGAARLLQTAKALGLADSIHLAEALETPACLLPTADDLNAAAALANISFGQGRLLLTPLHIARFTATVANGGVATQPYLIKGVADQERKVAYAGTREGERAVSQKTAQQLQNMMALVVEQGTGKKAQPDNVSVAGKTGTAQTGQYNQEKPVIQSWFTGYFPAEDPRYVVTVLAEDAETTGVNASVIFCEISNNLTEWEGEPTD